VELWLCNTAGWHELEFGPMGNISYIVIFRAYDNHIMEGFYNYHHLVFSFMVLFKKRHTVAVIFNMKSVQNRFIVIM